MSPLSTTRSEVVEQYLESLSKLDECAKVAEAFKAELEADSDCDLIACIRGAVADDEAAYTQLGKAIREVLTRRLFDEALDAKFESLDRGFEPLCDGCEYLTRWKESYPYGDGSAEENLVQCEGTAKLCPIMEVQG